MTVEQATVYVLEVRTDDLAWYVDLFDEGGQYLAAGSGQGGEFDWQ